MIAICSWMTFLRSQPPMPPACQCLDPGDPARIDARLRLEQDVDLDPGLQIAGVPKSLGQRAKFRFDRGVLRHVAGDQLDERFRMSVEDGI